MDANREADGHGLLDKRFVERKVPALQRRANRGSADYTQVAVDGHSKRDASTDMSGEPGLL